MIDTQSRPSFDRLVVARRATPAFSPTSQVAPEHLKMILCAGLLAPSSYNLQPWRFVVVRDQATRRDLRIAAMNQDQVEQAPVVIVACGDPTAWRDDLETVIEITREHGIIDEDRIRSKRAKVRRDLASHPNMSLWVTKQTMIAATTMMWMAEALGYDTAPMEGFYEDRVREVLKIPSDLCVLFLLAIGKLDGPDGLCSGRLPQSRTVFGDRYDQVLELDLSTSFVKT
jgi:nitroreductase